MKSDMYDLNTLIASKEINPEKVRLSIGGGSVDYSNTIILELTEERNNTVDVNHDVRLGIPFEDESFYEVLMIHVIEHIEKKFHKFVFDEIWRVLKPNGRLVMGFPDFIECAKAFIKNKAGARWSLYEPCIFGRQDGTGDYHVTAIEEQDIKSRLFNAGFKDVKYKKFGVNVTLSAYKGDKLNDYI